MGKQKITETLEELTDKQKAVLVELKTHILEGLGINDPRYDDWYLLRFVIARKYKIKDVMHF